MGIKGIYRELGPGKRVSLSKLASDSFAQHNRPYRLAIDIAIWQFQNQAARGGTNPAIRTLFYRLVRLLGTPIQPIFVFDGPNKPKFKRSRRSGRGDGFAAAHAKRLIRLFGFVAHDAPGEAEAECAFLQRNGIVDAVLSEDVDTIMFGCTRTLRNWTAEGKGTKPTHVSMYDVEEMNLANLGLDREGMVLVALMSGGDYIPEGVPGCGPKVACEAAKAGFGKSLCRLRIADEEGLRQWKKSLTHELHTNESKFFRTRHKALAIPEDFPNVEALRYYTHPVVSPESILPAIRQKLSETREIQLEGLREFARETFNWDFRIGAIKFIRVLSEGLFVSRMHQDDIDGDSLVKKVSGRRTHFSTDGTPELRLAYIPEEIVPIDISNEVEEEIAYARSGLALNSDEEFTAPESVEDAQGSGKTFDISKPELTWVLEEVARRFAPKSIQAWEEGKTKRKSPKKKTSKSKKADAVPNSTLDSFVRVTKTVKGKEKAFSSDTSDTDSDIIEINKVDKLAELNESEHVSLPPLPQPTQQLRRPHTPPFLRQPSKHLAPGASPSMDGWTVISSPDSPRRHDDAGSCEAIVISSSPAGDDSSPVSRPVPASPVEVAGEAGGSAAAAGMPKSIRSILAANAASARMRGGEGRSGAASSSSSIHKAKGKAGSFSKTSQGAAKLKQLSMDTFTQSLARTEMDRPGPSNRAEKGTHKPTSGHEVSSTETLNKPNKATALNLPSSPPPPPSSLSSSRPLISTKRTTPSAPPQPEQDFNLTATKKLLVPSASRPGFFDEIEVEAEEYEERIAREARRLRSRGAGSGVTRWSDVSFIDLTGGNDSTTR